MPRVDDQWVDATEPSCTRTFVDDGLEGLDHVGEVANDRRVEMGAAFGDFAKPDRRKVRAGLCLRSDGLDEEADLRSGGTADVRRGRGAAPDGLKHVVQDLAVERRLAAEVVVDHRLVHAGGTGDPVDAGAGEAMGRELGGGRGEEARTRPFRSRGPRAASARQSLSID